MTVDRLKRKSGFFWLFALLAAQTITIGFSFLFAPVDAAERYGVTVDGSQGMVYLWAKGMRDFVLGLLGFFLLALRVRLRVLAVFSGVLSLIPLGDFVNAYAHAGADNTTALLIHAGTAAFAGVLALCLWKGSREPEAAQHYFERRHLNNSKEEACR
jgi:Domain of unknown function (DUF4267)